MIEANPALSITPHGRLMVTQEPQDQASSSSVIGPRIVAAFEAGMAAGLVHLATAELSTALTGGWAYARDFARRYFTDLCHLAGLDSAASLDPLAPPGPEDLAFLAMQAPPMKGLEYLSADVLRGWWIE